MIATQSIFSSQIELPEFETQSAGSGGSGDSELDQELSESIAVFEGKILDARREVLETTPPPTSAENIPGVAILGGSSESDENDPGAEEGSLDQDVIVQQGRMPNAGEVADANMPESVPDDIPSPQGDDIVAQQLREAAVAETNPELKAKLWDEYKKYKAGL